MKYLIKYRNSKNVIETTTDFREISSEHFAYGCIEVEDIENHETYVIGSIDEWEQLCDELAMRNQWKSRVNHLDEINKAVDPKHYKGYVDDYQWIETMMRIPTMRDPKVFTGALELQVRKYLDRNGQKDNSLQEMKKALFYLKFLVLYLEKGVDAKVEDVFNEAGL